MKLFIFLFSMGWSSALFSQYRTTAYSWDVPDISQDNIVPFCWVGTYAIASKMFKITNIHAISDKLKSMPEGKRCLFLWDQHRSMIDFPADRLKDPVNNLELGFNDTLGVFHPFPTVWWDNGAIYVQQFYNTLFAGLKQLEAPIDMVVLDFENGINNWTMSRVTSGKAIKPEQKDSILTTYYQAIMSDVRAPSLFSELGFTDLLTVKNWFSNGNKNYLIFNDVWWRKRSKYLDIAVTGPLHTYYPKARISNYNDAYLSDEFPVPDYNGHNVYCCGNTGTHTGTHQSDSYYGYLDQVCTYRLPEKVTSFPKTEFNALLYTTNSMKAARLSHPEPLIGWIAYPGFQENKNVLFENSPYFFENLFHLLLSGSEDVLFWNPKPLTGSTLKHSEEAQQVSNAMLEFDKMWNETAPHLSLFYPSDTITAWDAPYVLTGMESDSMIIWRFSPRLDSVWDDPMDFLYDDMDSIIFDIRGTLLKFPSGSVISPVNSVSDVGLWIVNYKEKNETATEKNDFEILFQIYPNPTKDKISINSSISPANIYLFDHYGTLVKIFHAGKEVSLEGLTNGMYFLKLFSDDSIVPIAKKVFKF